MTTNYTITENPIFNSREVTFDTKPATEIQPEFPPELSDLYSTAVC